MDANHTLLHFADKPVVHVLEEDRSPFFAWMASPGYLGDEISSLLPVEAP